MDFFSIASGSSGNCICIGNGKHHLLIDAGISGKKIEEGMNQNNLNKRKVYGNAIDCKIDSLSNSVTLLGIDTGVKLIYHFRKVDNTCFLVQIEDLSN